MALKNKDLAKLTASEITARLAEMQKEFMKLRAQRMTGASQKNNRQIRTMRRTRARLLTRQNMMLKQQPAQTAKNTAVKKVKKKEVTPGK